MNAISLSLLFALFSFTTQAATIAFDDTEITKSAQKYESTISVTGGHNYSNLYLNLTAKGDYDRVSNEYIEFAIDGNVLAKWNASTSNIKVTTNSKYNDYTLTGNIAISDKMWEEWIADSILNISWKNGPRTNAYPHIAGADYVSYMLNGDTVTSDAPLGSAAVPVPATWILMSTALLGFKINKRKFIGFARRT